MLEKKVKRGERFSMYTWEAKLFNKEKVSVHMLNQQLA